MIRVAGTLLLASFLATHTLSHAIPKHNHHPTDENPDTASSRAKYDDLMRQKTLDIMSTAFEVPSAGLRDCFANGRALGLRDYDKGVVGSGPWAGEPHFCRFVDLMYAQRIMFVQPKDMMTMTARCCERVVLFRRGVGAEGEEVVDVLGMVELEVVERRGEMQWAGWVVREVEAFFELGRFGWKRAGGLMPGDDEGKTDTPASERNLRTEAQREEILASPGPAGEGSEATGTASSTSTASRKTLTACYPAAPQALDTPDTVDGANGTTCSREEGWTMTATCPATWVLEAPGSPEVRQPDTTASVRIRLDDIMLEVAHAAWASRVSRICWGLLKAVYRGGMRGVEFVVRAVACILGALSLTLEGEAVHQFLRRVGTMPWVQYQHMFLEDPRLIEGPVAR